MKKWKCDGCGAETEVFDEYTPEFCCDGKMCGCYGAVINPIFCEKCEEIYLGKEDM